MCVLAAACGFSSATALGQVNFTITVVGIETVSNPTTTNLLAAIQSNALAGMRDWTQDLAATGSPTINAVVRFDAPAGTRGSGRSLTSSFVRTTNGFNIYEQGAMAELRTGIDPNGASYDVEFVFEANYFRDQVWFDPDPRTRTAPVPNNRLDAVSWFAHEFGHALAFNGWKIQATGGLPGNYQSTYDEQTTFDGTDWSFIGPETTRLYREPLPMARVNNNYHHYGNPLGSGAPGTEVALRHGVMNGAYFEYGIRFPVKLLDLAILKDTGVPLSPAVSFATPGILSFTWPGGGNPQLLWTTTPLGNYRVEFSDDLEGGWQDLTQLNYLPSALGTLRAEDTSTSKPAKRFYRVGLAP